MLGVLFFRGFEEVFWGFRGLGFGVLGTLAS